MRLTKKIYFAEQYQSGVIEDLTWGGTTPIYEWGLTDSFKAEIEPFSQKLALDRYGLEADATNRLFCKYHPKFEEDLTTFELFCDGRYYDVKEFTQYDRHCEILIKRNFRERNEGSAS